MDAPQQQLSTGVTRTIAANDVTIPLHDLQRIAASVDPPQSVDDVLQQDIPTMDSQIFARVNDRVNVYWKANKTSFPGTISEYSDSVDIDAVNGVPYNGPPVAGYQVDYDDGASLWHTTADANEMLTVIVANVNKVASTTAYPLEFDSVVEFATGLFSNTGYKFESEQYQFSPERGVYVDASGTERLPNDDPVLAARAFNPLPSVRNFIDTDTGQIK